VDADADASDDDDAELLRCAHDAEPFIPSFVLLVKLLLEISAMQQEMNIALHGVL